MLAVTSRKKCKMFEQYSSIQETDVPPNDKGFKSRADSMSSYKFD